MTLTVTAALAESSNWFGCADLDATFGAVGASWTVLTLDCSGKASSYSAQWIGIDGYSSNTVEQDGTEADCLNGSPSYDAWYEMYGDSAVDNGYEVELNPASGYYPVSPGDTITASVSVGGSSWTLSVADSTQHWNYSTPISFSGASKSSAEWIVERPEVCSRSCSLTSLADYGSVTFLNATASVGSSSEPISS
ncbi:MAG: G1 family glutamic endopeptidase [Acidimicrobiales bacterium]